MLFLDEIWGTRNQSFVSRIDVSKMLGSATDWILMENVDIKTSWQIHEGYDLLQISGKDLIETWQELHKSKCQDSCVRCVKGDRERRIKKKKKAEWQTNSYSSTVNP